MEKENKHLSDVEEAFFQHVMEGNISEVKNLIGQLKVDVEKKDGMTPLMYAAYKGNADMTEYLIAQGADVNKNSQKDWYTPLMFAALSGSVDCVRLLLESGAKSDVVNKINRTASQLGAFTGRHDCVSVINNFVQLDDIVYYTQKHGLEEEGMLPKHLASPMHKFIVTPNLNPVKLVLFLRENELLVDNHTSVDRVLTAICQKSFKDVNELLAMKAHLFNQVLGAFVRWKSGTEGKDGIDGLLKHLLKCRSEDGCLIGTETLLRDSLKSFPYTQSNVFKQLVTTLSHVPLGGIPSALVSFTQSINGMQSADFAECCYCCGDRHCSNRCSNCKTAKYCNATCQRLHWFSHKKFCKSLKEEYVLAEKQKEIIRMEEEKETKQKAEENKKDVDVIGPAEEVDSLST